MTTPPGPCPHVLETPWGSSSCCLLAGHIGLHQADDGAKWGVPVLTVAPQPCALCGAYDHREWAH